MECKEADSPTSRLELVFGREGVQRLAESCVMVLGVGGVGSNCVEALARGGVGRLIVVDHDVVQPSNINRQAIAFHSTVGQHKVDAMRALVADINPEARVEAIDRLILPEDVEGLFAAWEGQVDWVVDAVDTVSTKLAIAAYADRTGLPLISSMGAANRLRPECLRITDISETTNCPLSRVVRKEARKRGIKRLRVLYSCEEPFKLPAREGAEAGGRPTLGTVSYVPPIMGQMIAGYVIRRIVGIES